MVCTYHNYVCELNRDNNSKKRCDGVGVRGFG